MNLLQTLPMATVGGRRQWESVASTAQRVKPARTAATPSKRPMSRVGFTDLPPAGRVQTGRESRPVAVLVSSDANAGSLAAGTRLDPDRLHLADTVLQAGRKRIATRNPVAATE